MKAVILLVVSGFFTGCGAVLFHQRGNPQAWVETCEQECRESPYNVRILERDGNETRIKIAIVTIRPPYVCRCD